MTEKNSKGRISKSSPVIYKGELISKEEHGVTSKIALDLLKIQKNDMSLDAVVHFKCKNLEKALRKELEIPYRPITRGDLAGITKLQLDGLEITDLSGLEGMTQLTNLYLFNNQISDISPLQVMTQLKRLWLSHNKISDISPLQGMTQMTNLYLEYNNISDISPLQCMTQMFSLWLDINQITDISPLKGMTRMSQLCLFDRQISDSQKEELKKALPYCKIKFFKS